LVAGLGLEHLVWLPVQTTFCYHKMNALINLLVVGMPVIVMGLALILMGEW
jgi:hypothetical protein